MGLRLLVTGGIPGVDLVLSLPGVMKGIIFLFLLGRGVGNLPLDGIIPSLGFGNIAPPILLIPYLVLSHCSTLPSVVNLTVIPWE